jgi:hypothetical protein
MVFNKRVIIGAVVIAMILAFYGVLGLNGYAHRKSTSGQATAFLTVIAANSIPTMDTALMFTTATPTIDPAIGNLAGITLGAYVQIDGTSGVGLNIHDAAGKSSDVGFIAAESEVFKVIGGPVEKDGIVWWQLATPYDETRQGWAAADYLSLIQE